MPERETPEAKDPGRHVTNVNEPPCGFDDLPLFGRRGSIPHRFRCA